MIIRTVCAICIHVVLIFFDNYSGYLGYPRPIIDKLHAVYIFTYQIIDIKKNKFDPIKAPNLASKLTTSMRIKELLAIVRLPG